MRTLCLIFKTPQENSCAEAFLSLSPRVQFRFPNFIFIDIESTKHLFGGETACLKKALEIAKKFPSQSPLLKTENGGKNKNQNKMMGIMSREAPLTDESPLTPQVHLGDEVDSTHSINIANAAIADTPAVAQMLARWKPFSISLKGQDEKSFQGLGLEALLDLEGLMAWSQKTQIQHVISFARSLGLCTLQEIANFRLVSLRERWGDFGVLLWNRLHSQDKQVISPLVPRDSLTGYVYLEDALSSVPLLFNHLKPQLDALFARLHGLGRFARKIEVVLSCEYSDHKHILEIEPVSPSRDQILFEDLLLKRMERTELTNPIREMEISIHDAAEKVHQLDFFEPRDNSEERWRRLISFAKQAECEMGFLQLDAHHFPEKSFQLVTEWPEDFKSEDLIEYQNNAVQIKTTYAKALAQSPRPSLLLEQPQALSAQELARIRFISSIPNERIESAWWQISAPEFKYRDYYFAQSHQGQMLWVFQDRMSAQYYLHGYFD